ERHRVGAPRDSDLKRAPDCVRAHVLVLSFDPIVGAMQVARSRCRVSESIRLSLATVAGIGLSRSLARSVSTGPPWVGWREPHGHLVTAYAAVKHWCARGR